MPFFHRHRPDPCEEVSRTLLCRQTLPCGLRFLASVLGSGFLQASTAPGPGVARGSRWVRSGLGVWSLKHLSLMTPLLISLPISSPDEPLKWQYVDQFVSGSEVRARTTSDGVWVDWSSRRGSQSCRGTCSRDVPSGAPHRPQCIWEAPCGWWALSQAQRIQTTTPSLQGKNDHQAPMGTAVLMSSSGHLHT